MENDYNKSLYIHTMEFYAVIMKEQENSILADIKLYPKYILSGKMKGA